MTDTARTPYQRLLHWLATEPFLHFVLLGACIFAAYGVWGSNRDALLRITVSQADQERLRAVARQQWNKDPDAAQMRSLVDQHIREEVLYREAMALELQRDDAIVRRRLVQKMAYLLQDDTNAVSEKALQDYFMAHAGQYAAPATVDLQLRTFDPAQRGAAAKADALLALRRARAGKPVVGDPFMLGTLLSGQSPSMLERDFGSGFAQAVADLPVGLWSGPIASVHGWHLVFLAQRAAAPPVRFEDVRTRVANDLVNSAGNAASDAAVARLRARYTVDVQGTSPP